MDCVDRVLNTFKDGDKNLSVLLVGLKGSGKTLTAKQICIKSQLPVLLIDELYEGTDFISFLSSPELGSCVIFIDEYEKIYTRRDGELTMLQILDGACNAKHLFVLTVNEMSNINSNLINRPSRIFYRKIYESIPDDVLVEILNKELINQAWREEMMQVFDKFTSLSYDIVMSLVNEVNRYDESPLECAKLMNFTPEAVYVSVTQTHPDGKTRMLNAQHLYLSEVKHEVSRYHKSDSDSDYDWIYIPTKDLKRIARNTWEYKDEFGNTFTFTKTSFSNLLF
jgi:SpoVK/Ycf46/Vps4 family AAA+-type ATPase